MFAYAAENDEVFAYVARDIVLDAFKGINGCVFAYGQTGAFAYGIPSIRVPLHTASRKNTGFFCLQRWGLAIYLAPSPVVLSSFLLFGF